MSEPKDQNEAACGGSALTAELAGKPEPLQFAIGQANVAMRTLVDYESQYKSSSPKEIQNRILAMADFIKARLDEYLSGGAAVRLDDVLGETEQRNG